MAGELRMRQTEEMTSFVGNVAESDQAAGFANKVEQITILASGCIRPLAPAWPSEMDIKGATLAVHDVANDPEIARANAGGEIMTADRLCVLRETACEV